MSDNRDMACQHCEGSYRNKISKLEQQLKEAQDAIKDAVQYLKEGKAKFTPSTDNSLVDRFIEKWGIKNECRY